MLRYMKTSGAGRRKPLQRGDTESENPHPSQRREECGTRHPSDEHAGKMTPAEVACCAKAQRYMKTSGAGRRKPMQRGDTESENPHPSQKSAKSAAPGRPKATCRPEGRRNIKTGGAGRRKPLQRGDTESEIRTLRQKREECPSASPQGKQHPENQKQSCWPEFSC